ncbi:hypothetical protein CRM22_010443 [Opisthorchis felineus]|uniref:Inositol polyphosphate-related phosphatase domain-containing protein n=1 Tax=Opisthorchis felineus TaxID=147828 RepID=A0A4V3SC30_OPIFE|nr:hypothetical protein CRM22_010443 [Opisthorchis felineus]
MPLLNVRCCTWNVGDDGPPEDNLNTLLGLNDVNPPDILAVGLQEVIDPSDWRKALIKHAHPAGYVLMKSRNCWAIWMFVFIRRNLLSAITNIESEVTPVGYAGVMGNKGGVSVRFEICGVNVIFLSCHFAAHAERTQDRLNDFWDIIKLQSFRDDDVHTILDHDYVFWMGDLNFRLDGLDKPTVEKLIDQKRFSKLISHDQLSRSRRKKLIFIDFLEGDIDFPPTFKFDKGTDQYDSSSKQRIPAWTDRILYMAHRDFATEHYATLLRDLNSLNIPRRSAVRGSPSNVEQHFPSNSRESIGELQPEIKLLEYTSLPEYKSSDHRPVVGSFEFAVPSRWFSLPVSFIEPMGKDYPFGVDLEFSYTVMDPPALLHMTESDKILMARPAVPTVSFIQLMLISAMGKLAVGDKNEGSTNESPLAPASLEQARRDWIGLYPADFADLERGYLTYVQAPKTVSSIAKDVHAEASKKPMPSYYKGAILAQYLNQLKNQSVQLIYWSQKKNCPQGYSSSVLIKE